MRSMVQILERHPNGQGQRCLILMYLPWKEGVEKADLVAEWRIREPAWQTFFVRNGLDRQFRIRMRLVPQKREVRTLDEQWEVTWVGTTPKVAISGTYGRGPMTTGLQAVDQ